jgi:DNA mismatch endonuclease (patch repair protein)
MVANRSKDTTPEIRLRKELYRRGLRYRKHAKLDVLGNRWSVDIAFPRQRVAVFVDGCFWHGCPEHMTWPKANADWWQAKIERTRSRDRGTTERLVRADWHVIRLWEHEPVGAAADQIEARLAASVATRVRP